HVPLFPAVFGTFALAGLPLELFQGLPYLFLYFFLGGLHLGHRAALTGPSRNGTFGRSVCTGLPATVFDDTFSALSSIIGICGRRPTGPLGLLFLLLGLIELG